MVTAENGDAAGMIALVGIVESLVGTIADDYAPIATDGRCATDGGYRARWAYHVVCGTKPQRPEAGDGMNDQAVGSHVFNRIGRSGPADVRVLLAALTLHEAVKVIEPCSRPARTYA